MQATLFYTSKQRKEVKFMSNKKTNYKATLVLVVVTLLACNMAMSAQKESGKSFQAIPGETDSVINGVKIKYFRDDQGCALRCQFWNDPKRCEGLNNEKQKCPLDDKPTYVECLPSRVDPKIEGETVKGAGNTTDPAQFCNEFRITTHGSPGWVWNYLGGRWYLVCLGTYVPGWGCCDSRGCVPQP